MKKVLVTLMVCIAVACFAEEKRRDDEKASRSEETQHKWRDLERKNADEKASWSEDFVACQELAKKTGKPIFALFTGSDWCIWCKRLEGEVLSKDEFLKYAGRKLILFKADFPSKIPQLDELKRQNENLQRKYGIRGYPTVLLLDKNGEIIGKTGYQKGGPEKYVEHIKKLIKDDK